MNLIASLLWARVGLRVKSRCAQALVDGTHIPAGALGTTKSATCAGAIVGVQWDGRDDQLDTRFDELEVVSVVS